MHIAKLGFTLRQTSTNKLKWTELGTRKRSSKLEMMDWIKIKSKGKDQHQIKQTCSTVLTPFAMRIDNGKCKDNETF